MKRILTATASAVGATLLVGSFALGDLSLPQIQSQLDNHEQRITKVETAITPSPSVTTSSTTPIATTPTVASSTTSTSPAKVDSTPTVGVPQSAIVAPIAQDNMSGSITNSDHVNTYQPTTPIEVATPTEVTTQEIQDLFAKIGLPGENRDRKVAFCYSLYSQHNQPKYYADAICGYEPQLLTYSNY